MASLPLIRGPGKGLRIVFQLTARTDSCCKAHKAVRRDCDWNEVVLRDGEALQRSSQQTVTATESSNGIHEPVNAK